MEATEATTNEIWGKALAQQNNDPEVFRKDYAGAWIKRNEYGNRDSQYGWEFGYIRPLEEGGTDSIENIYPMQWQNKDSKGDNYPQWYSVQTSDGTVNVEQKKNWHI